MCADAKDQAACVDDRQSRRSEAWTDYWSTGALHSCGGTYQGLYGGGIGEFWSKVFGALPDRCSVLDLCCGNGALSRALSSAPAFAAGTGIRVDAVDAAQVDPAWLSTLPDAERARIRFHPGVDAQRLPFDDATYDLCMSQYGIEYAPPEAWDEARRILRPGGRFAAIVHHHESLPVRIAREEVGHLAWLCAAGGLLDSVRDLLPWMALAGTPGGVEELRGHAQANAARERLREALGRLEARAAGARYPDVLGEASHATGRVLQGARETGEAKAAEALARLEEDLARQRLRAGELVECALGEAALQALTRRISADGSAEVSTVRFETGDLAGWSVMAEVRA